MLFVVERLKDELTELINLIHHHEIAILHHFSNSKQEVEKMLNSEFNIKRTQTIEESISSV